MRITGFLMAAVGMLLLAFAIDAGISPMERLSQAMTGRSPDTTLWYLIAGTAATIGGGLLAAFAPRSL